MLREVAVEAEEAVGPEAAVSAVASVVADQVVAIASFGVAAVARRPVAPPPVASAAAPLASADGSRALVAATVRLEHQLLDSVRPWELLGKAKS